MLRTRKNTSKNFCTKLEGLTKMIPFAPLLVLLLFQYQSLDAVHSSEKVLEVEMVQKMCNSFNELKCPHDDYCFNNERNVFTYARGNQKACKFCPSGGEKDDCDRWLQTKTRWNKPKDRYARCPMTQRYYHKETYACTWRNNCPAQSKINNNSTTESNEECSIQYCRDLVKPDPWNLVITRSIKCVNDTKCVSHESECDICTSTNGGNESLCTEKYCESLKLTRLDRSEFGKDHKYMKCPKSAKCILKGQWCNGIGDCPGNEDEIKCSEEECQKIGKTKCPNENKCIEDRYACSDHNYEKYPRNRCKYNGNCISKCQRDGTKFFCPRYRPWLSIAKSNWMDDNCPLLSQQCNHPDESIMKFLNLTQKLWRCSIERKQYIPIAKVCDGVFDCLLNEDESENICKSFSISMAIGYSSAIVCGIITIMICLKSFNFVSHKFMCKECLKKYNVCLGQKEWAKKKRLLTMLMGEECKELITSKNFKDFMSSTWKEQQQAYLDAHEDASKGNGLKAIFKYIHNRLEQKVTSTNLTRVMNQRQKIYEKIYTFELHCHGNDEAEAIRCLYKNKGGKIMDLKQKPTIFTRAGLTASLLSRTVFRSSIKLPTIKMIFFVMDLTKDAAFALYLYETLFNEKSEDRISSDDICLFSIYISSLLLGQILLSVLCFVRRYSTVSMCPHNGSRYVNSMLSATMIVLFPVTGIIMSTNTYMDDRLVKDQFQRVSNGWTKTQDKADSHNEIDWSISSITKQEYEQIVAKLNFVEKHKSLGGFEFMKVMECLIESFLQILVTLVIFNQLTHEGILNESIFAFSTTCWFPSVLLLQCSSYANLLFLS